MYAQEDSFFIANDQDAFCPDCTTSSGGGTGGSTYDITPRDPLPIDPLDTPPANIDVLPPDYFQGDIQTVDVAPDPAGTDTATPQQTTGMEKITSWIKENPVLAAGAAIGLYYLLVPKKNKKRRA